MPRLNVETLHTILENLKMARELQVYGILSVEDRDAIVDLLKAEVPHCVKADAPVSSPMITPEPEPVEETPAEPEAEPEQSSKKKKK